MFWAKVSHSFINFHSSFLLKTKLQYFNSLFLFIKRPLIFTMPSQKIVLHHNFNGTIPKWLFWIDKVRKVFYKNSMVRYWFWLWTIYCKISSEQKSVPTLQTKRKKFVYSNTFSLTNWQNCNLLSYIWVRCSLFKFACSFN